MLLLYWCYGQNAVSFEVFKIKVSNFNKHNIIKLYYIFIK